MGEVGKQKYCPDQSAISSHVLPLTKMINYCKMKIKHAQGRTPWNHKTIWPPSRLRCLIVCGNWTSIMLKTGLTSNIHPELQIQICHDGPIHQNKGSFFRWKYYLIYFNQVGQMTGCLEVCWVKLNKHPVAYSVLLWHVKWRMYCWSTNILYTKSIIVRDETTLKSTIIMHFTQKCYRL